jgi:hypothetical protein
VAKVVIRVLVGGGQTVTLRPEWSASRVTLTHSHTHTLTHSPGLPCRHQSCACASPASTLRDNHIQPQEVCSSVEDNVSSYVVHCPSDDRPIHSLCVSLSVMDVHSPCHIYKWASGALDKHGAHATLCGHVGRPNATTRTSLPSARVGVWSQVLEHKTKRNVRSFNSGVAHP